MLKISFGLTVLPLLLTPINGQAHFDYTIDCDSFKAVGTDNSCNDYGSTDRWNKIIDRPLPDWYADMKLGIFIHWGVFSVPSYGTEWFWYNYACRNNSVKAFADKVFPEIGIDYPKYADMWKAELYDPVAWVNTFKGAGAQYVLPVAKHHDGFCLWDASETSPMWNAAQAGPKRDVLTELYNASIDGGLPFGIYYSQGEWFDSNFVADAKQKFAVANSTFHQKKTIPQRLDLVNRFSKAMLWHTDGGWMAPDKYWDNLDWLTYVVEDSPLHEKVVSCNSMGYGCCAHHGTGAAAQKCWEYGDAPSGGDRTTAGMVTSHFYTNQMTLQRGSWSWDRSENEITDFFSTRELLWTLISTTAWNGTLVMNIGPMADGTIPPIFEDRLAGVGSWLATNGEAIYGTRPWMSALPSGMEGSTSPDYPGSQKATYYTMGGKNACQFGTLNCKTSAEGIVYGITMGYPDVDAGGKRTLNLKTPKPTQSTTVALLTAEGPVQLTWKSGDANGGIAIDMPPFPTNSSCAWTLKFTNLGN